MKKKRIKSPAPSGITAVLSFALPEETEALTNAVEANKWQTAMADVIATLSCWRDITAKDESREAFRSALTIIKEILAEAGLSVISANQLVKLRMRMQKVRSKQLGKVHAAMAKEYEDWMAEESSPDNADSVVPAAQAENPSSRSKSRTRRTVKP